MEDKRLKRVFDQVKLSREREEAMLADLLNEKKEVSSMKQTNRRRIPAAVFAAVLAAVLAGTALAVEYWGRINIVELLDGYAGERGKWYGAYMEGGRIPADSLSENIWATSDSASEKGNVHLTFDSRLEAETFLGLDLADNALLEQMPVDLISYSPDDQTVIQSPCFMEVTYSSGQIPAVVTVQSYYMEEEPACRVFEFIEFGTDFASEKFEPGARSRMGDEADFQVYVTPNGIEATIYSGRGKTDTFIHSAYFVKNNVFYSIDVFSSDLDTLIEILDAYE